MERAYDQDTRRMLQRIQAARQQQLPCPVHLVREALEDNEGDFLEDGVGTSDLPCDNQEDANEEEIFEMDS